MSGRDRPIVPHLRPNLGLTCSLRPFRKAEFLTCTFAGIWSFLSYLSVGTIEVWIWLDDDLRPSSNVVMALFGRYSPCGCTFLSGDSSDVARHFPVAIPGLHWEAFLFEGQSLTCLTESGQCTPDR